MEESPTIADELRIRYQVQGILVAMAEAGLLTELRCGTERCFSPTGRDQFDPIEPPLSHWLPSKDHFPKLKRDGGHRVADNVRLAHRLCNILDFAYHDLPKDRREAAVVRWRRKYGWSP